MIRTPRRLTSLLLLASALALATVAAAALKDKPPKGVALHATGWLIDPYRSDDPDTEIERAIKQQREAQNNRNRDVMDRGVEGDDGPLGRGYGSDSTWGGGLPSGGRRRDDMPNSERYPNDRSGWGRHTDRTSTDIDPMGRSGSITLGTRGGGTGGNEFLGQLTRNPEKLSFLETNRAAHGIRRQAGDGLCCRRHGGDLGFLRRRRAPLRLAGARLGDRDHARQEAFHAHRSVRGVQGWQDAQLRDHRRRQRHPDNPHLADVHAGAAAGRELRPL